jgi:hypothetical protein
MKAALPVSEEQGTPSCNVSAETVGHEPKTGVTGAIRMIALLVQEDEP